MVLPLTLLRAAGNQAVLVELKNGETYSGTLVSNDGFMNLHLKSVVCTAKNGDRFWKMPVCYIRGSSIKLVRFSEAVVASARENPAAFAPPQQQARKDLGRGRGSSRGGRGRGRGRGGPQLQK